ncbi:MAG: DsbA family protein [Phenylobacterium sp.]|uniref:DsbA family protein n=1 Tax=Phenylobacterium sp. TaxID=1871053 RepID=UPI00391D3B0D
MQAPHLIYFADPMCSWCYGFSPVIAAIRREFGRSLPIRLVMGGLRPGTEEPMTPKAKAEIAGHWTHVTEATGLPFDPAVLEPEGFVYDTDPAARAVVWMRQQDSEKALALLARLHQAFYAQAQDVTDPQVLAGLIADAGEDGAAFLAALDSEALKHETWGDYGVSQRAGVTGFPTLVGGPGPDGTYGVVTRGYQPAEVVLPTLRAWLGAAPAEA